MNDLLFWLMAHLGRRGTALLLTALALLAFVASLTAAFLFVLWFAAKFPGVALAVLGILGLIAVFSQFIFAIAEAIEQYLPERKSKDE